MVLRLTASATESINRAAAASTAGWGWLLGTAAPGGDIAVHAACPAVDSRTAAADAKDLAGYVPGLATVGIFFNRSDDRQPHVPEGVEWSAPSGLCSVAFATISPPGDDDTGNRTVTWETQAPGGELVLAVPDCTGTSDTKTELTIHLRAPFVFDDFGGAAVGASVASQAAKFISELATAHLFFPAAAAIISPADILGAGSVASFLSDERGGGDPRNQTTGRAGKGKSGGKPMKSPPKAAGNKRTDGIADLRSSPIAVELIHGMAPAAGMDLNAGSVQLTSADAKTIRRVTSWVDIKVEVGAECHMADLHALLIRGVEAQLARFVDIIANSELVPKVFHYEESRWFPGLVTVTLPVTAGSTPDDSALAEERRLIHKRLGLPTDRPLFVSSRSLAAAAETGRLRNPHESLPASGVSGGVVAVVEGRYDYYHYMQDKFDDNGWGCAYRSWQTIVSWFVLNGYKQMEIPGHRAIQELCVANEARKASFVGSKEWIGSMEVGWLLQWVMAPDFELECKYLISVLGHEMGTKGRELLQHFETQGTPVMIGGNNLAHTILGVDLNVQTGDIKYLVLDPHYTGGWCAWKTESFWKRGVDYNLCLPMRPSFL